MGGKFLARDPSPRTIRKLVRALYQGVKNVNPTDQDYQRWFHSVSNGTSLAEMAAIVVAEAGLRRREETAAPLFVPPGHYYSPIVDPKEGAEAYDRAARAGVPVSLPGIALDREAMIATWRELVPLIETSGFQASPAADFGYGYENGMYAWGDGAILSAMIRKFRPAKIIEIGCGWSSACMVETLARTPDLECKLTFIEPNTGRLKERLGEAYSDYTVIADLVQNVDPELFTTLDAGDILFIDSTHVMKTGSDVCFEMFEILPSLKRGVLVHIHDMLWPFEYYRSWVVDDNRSWNEIYAYRALLMNNPNWEIVMFISYLEWFEWSLISSTWPFKNGAGSALWLRKR